MKERHCDGCGHRISNEDDWYVDAVGTWCGRCDREPKPYQRTSPPPFANALTVDWFKSARPTVPVTITVNFELDEIVEAVMERIAARMVGK